MKRVSPGSTDRFIAELSACDENCVIWPFAKNKSGYGITKRQYAHRVAFVKFHGEIPDGMVVMHSCDNPSCVNPAHLRAGSQKENLEDRRNKNRHPKGILSGTARLNDALVKDAREKHRNGISSVKLARIYGVSQSAMWYALSGKTWGHVDA